MKRYAAVTIGPIGDTMALALTPVSLWASSYLFSHLAKTLCRVLTEHGVPEQNIITPYYRHDEPLLERQDGVGLFHDRIVFELGEFPIERFDAVRRIAVAEVAAAFDLDPNYLLGYLRVEAAVFEADNPVAEGNILLDSFELARPFVTEEALNPFDVLFGGSSTSRNTNLRRTSVVSGLKEFQLRAADGTFKALGDIASTGSGSLRFNYYAIVHADGDGMHRVVEQLTSDDDIRRFSRTCLEYCAAVAALVAQYDGITVYSSGDDLLAILPCESREGKTPLHFSQEASVLYDRFFGGYKPHTTLSFGVAVAYHRQHLQEVLSRSAELLFTVAKRGGKNRFALDILSYTATFGIDVESRFVCTNGVVGNLLLLMERMRSLGERGRPIYGMVSKRLRERAALFNGAEGEELYRVLQNEFSFLSDGYGLSVAELFTDVLQQIKHSGEPRALDGVTELDDPALTLSYLLRMCQFFIGKGGDAE